MIEKLKAKFDGQFRMSEPLWTEIKANAKEIFLEKNEALVPYSSLKKAAYAVVQGSLKQSIIDSSGEKTTTWFFFEHIFDVAVCLDSYILQEHTKYEITALEKSWVYQIRKDKVDDWCQRFPEFNKFYREDILNSFFLATEIKNHMASHTPAEFVHYLQKYYPEIIAKVPSKYLAEFMGITAEWLSKIKKTISKE
ncbi:MAG: hypothetical protein AAF765_02170 [Bacteroidota bacterium]